MLLEVKISATKFAPAGKKAWNSAAEATSGGEIAGGRLYREH